MDTPLEKKIVKLTTYEFDQVIIKRKVKDPFVQDVHGYQKLIGRLIYFTQASFQYYICGYAP